MKTAGISVYDDPQEFLDAMDAASFSYRDILGKDTWIKFTPTFSLTVVGTPTYIGRFRIVGKSCFFQAQFSATTSVASAAGTSYMVLPAKCNAQSISGFGGVSNNTQKLGNVGNGHIDVATSRFYTPAILASAHVFNAFGWYEI